MEKLGVRRDSLKKMCARLFLKVVALIWFRTGEVECVHHQRRKQDPSVFKGSDTFIPNITVYGSIIMTDYLGELTSALESLEGRNGTVSPKMRLAVNRGKRVREETLHEVPFPVAEWPPLKVSQCPHDDREKHGSSERGLSWAHYQILLEFVYFDYDVMKEWEQPGGLQKDSVYESNSFSSISSTFTAVGPKSDQRDLSSGNAIREHVHENAREALLHKWPPGLYKNGIPFKEDDIMVVLEDDALVAIKDIEGTLSEEFRDMRGIDLLYLGWCEGRTARPIPLCSHAYAVTRRGARKIIKHFEPCGLAYDWQFVIMIRNKWLSYRRAHRFSYENNYKPNFGSAFTRGIFQQMQNAGSFNGHGRKLLLRNLDKRLNDRFYSTLGDTEMLYGKNLMKGRSSSSDSIENIADGDEEILEKIYSLMRLRQLNKTANSNRTRLLFVAGLEESGHALIDKMFKRCNTDVYRFDRQLHNLLHWARKFSEIDEYSIDTRKKQIIEGLFGSFEKSYHDKILIRIYKHMKALEMSTSAAGNGKLFGVNTLMEAHSGTLSFLGNTLGPHRGVQNPDMHTIAAVAEAADLDFRVLVIEQPAPDSRRSLYGHPDVSTKSIEMANAAASELFSQMLLIDPSFFLCVNHNELSATSGDDFKTTVASFLHPQLAANNGQLFEDMLIANTASSSKPGTSKLHRDDQPTDTSSYVYSRNKFFLPESSIKYHSSRYRAILDKIERLCVASR